MGKLAGGRSRGSWGILGDHGGSWGIIWDPGASYNFFVLYLCYFSHPSRESVSPKKCPFTSVMFWYCWPPHFWKDPLQTNTYVTGESTAWVLCLLRRVEWISRVEHGGLFRIPCHTSGRLQGVLWVLGINRVWAIYLFAVMSCHT